MKLPIAYYGDPILRKKVKPVTEITDEIRTLVKDMIDTMKAVNGIGLAAPQVKKSLAIFVTNVPIEGEKDGKAHWEPGPIRVFINPKIIGYSEEAWNRDEGCLSIPGLYAEVIRPVKVTVQAMDLEGQLFEATFSWLDARAIFHEKDHLDGVLFIDRVERKKRLAIEQHLREIKRKYHPKGQ